MTDQPEAAGPRPRLPLVLGVVVVAGFVLELFCVLLLPFRVAGHLVPVGPVLVFGVNAAVATAGNRLAADRMPAQVLMGLSLVLAGTASVRGPGGDLLVTRDLEGMFLLFVLGALLGAGVPLFRRTRRE